MTILCSPTDSNLFSILQSTYPVISSLIPEKYGADVLSIDTNHGKLAIQRKTIPADFIASINDGRLMRELPLLSSVDYPVLILEGHPEWTTDNTLLSEYPGQFTKQRLRNLVRTISIIRKIHVEYTNDIRDTSSAIIELVSWYKKGTHNSLNSRPKKANRDDWNNITDRNTNLFILQGFTGVGSVLAEQILEHFGGKMPFKWNCTEAELKSVPGIGPKRFEQIWRIL